MIKVPPGANYRLAMITRFSRSAPEDYVKGTFVIMAFAWKSA